MKNLSPASKGSREVANLTWRKNLHTPVYGVKEFVCLSVMNFDPNYLRTGKIEWAEIFWGYLSKSHIPKLYCNLNLLLKLVNSKQWGMETANTQKTKSHFKKGSQVLLPGLFLWACFHPFWQKKSIFLLNLLPRLATFAGGGGGVGGMKFATQISPILNLIMAFLQKQIKNDKYKKIV